MSRPFRIRPGSGANGYQAGTRGKQPRYCRDCGTGIKKRSTRCMSCSRIARRTVPRILPETFQELYFRQGLSFAEIADRFKMSKPTVHNQFGELGLKARKPSVWSPNAMSYWAPRLRLKGCLIPGVEHSAEHHGHGFCKRHHDRFTNLNKKREREGKRRLTPAGYVNIMTRAPIKTGGNAPTVGIRYIENRSFRRGYG